MEGKARDTLVMTGASGDPGQWWTWSETDGCLVAADLITAMYEVATTRIQVPLLTSFYEDVVMRGESGEHARLSMAGLISLGAAVAMNVAFTAVAGSNRDNQQALRSFFQVQWIAVLIAPSISSAVTTWMESKRVRPTLYWGPNQNDLHNGILGGVLGIALQTLITIFVDDANKRLKTDTDIDRALPAMNTVTGYGSALTSLTGFLKYGARRSRTGAKVPKLVPALVGVGFGLAAVTQFVAAGLAVKVLLDP